MKVSIALTVDVDRAAWASEYGIDDEAPAVREDLREYVLGMVLACAAADAGCITSATLKP